jgi:hypothetical protein
MKQLSSVTFLARRTFPGKQSSCRTSHITPIEAAVPVVELLGEQLANAVALCRPHGRAARELIVAGEFSHPPFQVGKAATATTLTL